MRLPLGSIFSRKKEAKAGANGGKSTSSRNSRIFFGAITTFIALGCIKIITWAIYQGREPMKLALWMAIFGTAIAGFGLMTIRGDIKLRLHRVWTPVGLLMIAWVWFFMLQNALPVSNGAFDLLANQSAETYLFVTGFGLLIAFVDPSVLYKYSYFLIPISVFFFVYQLAGAIIGLPMFFIEHGLNITSKQINEMNDIWALLSAPLFLYYAFRKLRAERPPLKKIGITAAEYFGILLALLAIGGMIGGFFFPGDMVMQGLF